MTIVPIPLENCSSVKDFFEKGGKVQVPRPQMCSFAACQLESPLRKHGGYLRQMVYWGFAFLIYVFRFRCRKCGRTVSCPYAWMVPYCRFPAELIALSLDRYGDSNEEVTYRYLSEELSDLEFIEPALDIQETELYQKLKEKGAMGGEAVPRETDESLPEQEQVQEPAHTTVWTWVSFICRQSNRYLMQIQKERVREWKRSSHDPWIPLAAKNANSKKAFTAEKARQLDLLSLAGEACRPLIQSTRFIWAQLRTYFLEKGETQFDLLTELNQQM